MASVHVRKAAPGDPRAARKAPRRGAAAKAASGRKAPGKPTARKAPGKQPGRRRAATRAPFRSYTIEVTQVRKWTIGVPGSEARSMAEASEIAETLARVRKPSEVCGPTATAGFERIEARSPRGRVDVSGRVVTR